MTWRALGFATSSKGSRALDATPGGEVQGGGWPSIALYLTKLWNKTHDGLWTSCSPLFDGHNSEISKQIEHADLHFFCDAMAGACQENPNYITILLNIRTCRLQMVHLHIVSTQSFYMLYSSWFQYVYTIIVYLSMLPTFLLLLMILCQPEYTLHRANVWCLHIHCSLIKVVAKWAGEFTNLAVKHPQISSVSSCIQAGPCWPIPICTNF